jgi:hypothetical protein
LNFLSGGSDTSSISEISNQRDIEEDTESTLTLLVLGMKEGSKNVMRIKLTDSDKKDIIDKVTANLRAEFLWNQPSAMRFPSPNANVQFNHDITCKLKLTTGESEMPSSVRNMAPMRSGNNKESYVRTRFSC